jgi:TRAF3-interacting protein 1
LDSAGLGNLQDEVSPSLDKEIEACDGNEATTQELLGSVISKPKLTEKLLSKPPFRFLHDVISEITRVTGFATGLYSDEELDSALVQDKTQKILYLEKMVKLIGVHLNTVVVARPAKIVAGLEALNTNVLLQLLAVAAKNRPDSSRSVPRALEQLSIDAPALGDVKQEGSAPVKEKPLPQTQTVKEFREDRGPTVDPPADDKSRVPTQVQPILVFMSLVRHSFNSLS